MMWGGGWWGFGMGLIWLAFFGLIVAGVILAIRRPFDREDRDPRGKSALDLLDERFARSEIDREDYEERKRVLLDSRGR